jgi:hypothetical protein
MTQVPEHGSITWSNAPPRGTQEMAWPMLRIPAAGAKGLIILSNDMLGTNTHYYGGRTTPCDGQNCRACEDNSQKRWHGYLAVWMPKAAKKGILEITEAAGDAVAKAAEKRVSLRALSLAAQRVPTKANGKLVLQLTDSEWSPEGLPPAPDLRRILRRMWGLPADEEVAQMHQSIRDRIKELKGQSNHR